MACVWECEICNKSSLISYNPEDYYITIEYEDHYEPMEGNVCHECLIKLLEKELKRQHEHLNKLKLIMTEQNPIYNFKT